MVFTNSDQKHIQIFSHFVVIIQPIPWDHHSNWWCHHYNWWCHHWNWWCTTHNLHSFGRKTYVLQQSCKVACFYDNKFSTSILFSRITHGNIDATIYYTSAKKYAVSQSFFVPKIISLKQVLGYNPAKW